MLFVLALSVSFSALTTLFSDNLAQETTGRKVTTPRVPNWSTKSLMLFVVKPKVATAFRDSRLLTHLEVVLVPAWVRC